MSSVIYPITNLKNVEQLSIARGEGVYVYDDAGNQYLEALAGLWCSALGYGNEELISAITEQLKTLSYSHLFGGRTHQGAIDLADKLSGMVPVADARIFFSNSGSEANDSHIKMLRYYNNVTGNPQKKKIIALDRGYHGVTLASAALTGLPVMHTHFDIPTAELGILRADCPHYYRCHNEGESESEFVQRIVANLERLILAEGADTIAAFIAEPVMGAGGVVIPAEGYFGRVQALLKKHDILFWADEVICGFGRTGNDFGSTTMGIEPQLMSLAKQLSSAYIPISATVIPGEMYEAMVEPSAEVGIFGHGYTYTGHPVACAAANASLDLFESEPRLDQAARMEALLRQGLEPLRALEGVADVRVLGAIGVVELDDLPLPLLYRLRRGFIERGLWVRPFGRIVYLTPALVMEDAEIDRLCAGIGEVLRGI